MKAVLKNLKDQILTNDTKIMYCKICGGEYSANLGDYFAITDLGYKFRCCDRVMDLVMKQTVYKPVG